MIDINYCKIVFYEGWMNNVMLDDEVSYIKNVWYKKMYRIVWLMCVDKGFNYSIVLIFIVYGNVYRFSYG